MFRPLRLSAAALAVVMTTGVLAGCRSVGTVNFDPKLDLKHSFSMTGANFMEANRINSCIQRASEVDGRADYCRVVDGYEGMDNRNWAITIAVGTGADPIGVANEYGTIYSPPQNGCMSTFLPSMQYGCAIVFDDGSKYEGCVWSGLTGDPGRNLMPSTWYCDYRTRKQVVRKTSGGAWDYVLRKAWNWSGYVGSSLGCAGGIVGTWSGNPITLPLLRGCVDGPM